MVQVLCTGARAVRAACGVVRSVGRAVEAVRSPSPKASVAQDLVGIPGIEIGQGAAPPADLEQGLCKVGGRAAYLEAFQPLLQGVDDGVGETLSCLTGRWLSMTLDVIWRTALWFAGDQVLQGRVVRRDLARPGGAAIAGRDPRSGTAEAEDAEQRPESLRSAGTSRQSFGGLEGEPCRPIQHPNQQPVADLL